MSTLFTKIVQGEIPSHKVYEDEKFFAFLTIEPLAPGHTLLIPKKETDKWTDLEEGEVRDIFAVAQKLSQRLENIFEVKRVCVVIAGFMVPHVHIHLIPCNDEKALDFSLAKRASDEDLKLTLSRIHTL